MQNNILVHDIPESRDQNCAEKVKEALTKCGYNESYSVECIHTLGTFDKNTSRPRPIIARLHSYRQTEVWQSQMRRYQNNPPVPS